MTKQKSSPASNIIEIRLVDVIRFIKKYFLTLLVAGVVGGILAYAYTYSLPKTYESQILLLPEYGSLKKNSFSLFGGGTGDGAERLLPELYPTIMTSSPFGAYLLMQPVKDQDNKAYKTLKDYLASQAKPSLFSRLFSSSGSKSEPVAVNKLSYEGIISYTPEEESYIRNAISLVSSSIDQRSGIITITSETTDPFISTIVVELARKYLVQYVEDYRAAKATDKVDVLVGRVKEARQRLSSAEIALQSYRDRNRNVFLNVAKIEEQRLQADFVLAQSIYNDLVNRYELAKISVKDEKPVFKVLEPASVPLKRSGPKRVRIAIIGGVLGGLLCMIYILVMRERVFQNLLEPSSKSLEETEYITY
jgi:uncharacterized protein involved in exopolysaccharide biosynthesis